MRNTISALLLLLAVSLPAAYTQNVGRDNGIAVGQFPDAAFCTSTGLAASDGTQNRAGACSSTPQGAVPNVNRMVSTIITKPKNAETIDAKKEMVVVVDMRNLETGFFDDPQKDYYMQPQTLNNAGIIQGHQHITIQQMGSTQRALDATKFVFFKGLNDQAKDGRSLSVAVPPGTFKQNGLHRICSMSGTNAHQPPIMPVAQRGAQDDCIRINVTGA
ncbi:uncharacterized protein SPPG_07582 [Spizellomyces punctatus DAOM BR117]|uniref:Uncharacterized protein n=1 Tax=Spizellomyces punctatus (strain DAOM BR117) TaxID=645134 RepID=A0A0L0H8E3_SPIPD|nr:uncharacterized protein SPPG_07582 [Spizellomyces punctatus DAOM BR117]KNC97194.1 hypothetical protein SPPG_07582 [Spizellomyces punctatus DAOM BR117]|eukprot:XP_016605234.1 hypothetical protein SPPG_07582 [Spizellomyces punctatus DAOM BR117]